jgi:glycosyltransferase involved in cell wall biosynthesis
VRGGAEQLLIDFCLRATRVEATVACLAPGPFPDELAKAGVRVEAIDAKRLRYPWSWARTVRSLAALAREADVVFSWQVKGHYYGTPTARRARKPAAWWDHGIRPARGDARYAVDSMLPRSLRADLVVCSSRAAAARHRDALAIHPGIDVSSYERASREDARAALGLTADEPAIGMVGRLQPWKAQHELVRAAPAILRAHPRARFFVVGGTPGGFSAAYPRELERLASDLGVADRIAFLGQRDDVRALLPGFDVAVHATRAEPFGLVVVEAMAAGVPVVAHPSGGVPEIVTDGETGVLTADIAAGAGKVLGDPAFAARIAAAARERARGAFSIERFVHDVEEAIIGLSA